MLEERNGSVESFFLLINLTKYWVRKACCFFLAFFDNSNWAKRSIKKEKKTGWQKTRFELRNHCFWDLCNTIIWRANPREKALPPPLLHLIHAILNLDGGTKQNSSNKLWGTSTKEALFLYRNDFPSFLYALFLFHQKTVEFNAPKVN